MFRVTKQFFTEDGLVDQEGVYTVREMKKQLNELLDSAKIVTVVPIRTGALEDVAFEPLAPEEQEHD